VSNFFPKNLLPHVIHGDWHFTPMGVYPAPSVSWRTSILLTRPEVSACHISGMCNGR
jgi:hypothetical protein